MTEPVNPPSPATVPAYPQLGSPTFNAEAYAYGTAMPGVVTNINEMGQAAYTNATSAKEKALAAAGSADTASTKASEAADSAALAGTKATQAALSADAAAESATEAESAAIASTKLNLGDKASEPAVDNQGEPLRYGATYYNTTTNKWRVYTPFGWDDGISAPGSLVSKSGDKLSGALDWAIPVDVASAATTDIGAATSNRVRITGTTTITSLGSIAAGACRTVTFAGALTLTHNATSLILPGGANITTAAGDVAEFESLGAGNWRCTGYMRANGRALDTGDLLSKSGGTMTGTLVTKSVQESIVVANTGTAYAIDLSGGTVFNLTLTGNCAYTFPSATAGLQFTLIQNQDATGSRAVTWPANVRWPGGAAPTITATAGRADVISFLCDGIYWLGFLGGQGFVRA